MIKMRKVISIALVVLMIFALSTASFSALESPKTEGKYSISVNTEGNGSAVADKKGVDADGTVTLTATEGDGFFTKWIIRGQYSPVSGTEYTPVFTIKPLSDITAIASFSVEKDYLTIFVDTVGDGSATADPTKVKKDSGDTVTLTATEKGDTFTGWSLACDYQIVEGSLTSKTLVIKPLTDVHATAYFGKDVPANDDNGTNSGTNSGTNKGSTSPATGDYSVMIMALVLMAMGLGVFAVKKIKE